MQAMGELKRFKILLVGGSLFLVFAVCFLIVEREDFNNKSKLLLSEDQAPATLEPPKTSSEAEETKQEEDLKTALENETNPSAKETPLDSNCQLFQGTVLKKGSYEPVKTFSIVVYRKKVTPDKAHWIPWGLTSPFEDDSGCFEVTRPVESSYQYRMVAYAKGFRKGESLILTAEPGGITRGICIELESFPEIRGIVIDAATKAPVKNALVCSVTDSKEALAFDANPSSVRHAKTNVTGGFSLKLFSPEKHTLLTRHREFSESIITHVDPEIPLEISLHSGFKIQGIAFDPIGQPVNRGAILITGERGAGLPRIEHRIRTHEDGAFSSERLHPGSYFLWLEEVPGFFGTFFGLEKVDLFDRDVEGVTLGKTAQNGNLLGILMSHEDPVRGARIRVNRNDFWAEPYSLREEVTLAVTDFKGRFQLYGLKPGYFEFFVLLPGEKESRSGHRIKTQIKAKSPVEQVFHIGGGRVAGQLIHGESGKPIRGIDSTCYLFNDHRGHRSLINEIEISKKGSFEISCLQRNGYYCVFSAKGYALEARPFFSEGIGTKEMKVEMRPGGKVLAEVYCNALLSLEDITFSIKNREMPWIELDTRSLRRDRADRFIIEQADYKGIGLKCRCLHRDQVKNVAVPHDQTGHVEFFFDPPLEVSGHVFTDQQPIPNVRVCFGYRSPPFWSRFDKELFLVTSHTDAHGRYCLKVPKPDMYYIALFSNRDWLVSVYDPKKVYIPAGSYSLDFKIGSYSFSGTIIDGITKEPIPDAGVKFNWGDGLCERLGDKGGRFIFNNLSEDQGKLIVYAPGYYPPGQAFDIYLKDFDFIKRKEKLFPLGTKGARLRLVLEGNWHELTTHSYRNEVNISEKNYKLNYFFKQENSNTFFICGIPEGVHVIEVIHHYRRSKYKGKTEVELREGELVEVVVDLK